MSKEDFEGIRQYCKEQHAKRVADNPRRLAHACEVLEKHHFNYKVCNETTCQINVYIGKEVLTFYAGTGKILGRNRGRGINDFLRLCIHTRNRMMHDICFKEEDA